MKAIETVYRGFRFRSRLEARWAVVFDALDLHWDYEPEGFLLDDGRSYLPDFYVPRWDAFVEIKPDETGFDLCRGLAIGSSRDVYHFSGQIPSFTVAGELSWKGATYFPPSGEPEDSGYHICVCRYCGRIGIEYQGRWGRIDCGCIGKDDRYMDLGRSLQAIAAYYSARTARFEHGERPRIYRPEECPEIHHAFPEWLDYRRYVELPLAAAGRSRA